MKQKTNKMLIFTSLAAYFTYFIHGIGASILGQYKPEFAAAWGAKPLADGTLDVSMVVSVIAALGLGRLISLPFSGPLSDKYGRKLSGIIGVLCYVAYFFGMANSTSMAMGYAFAVIGGIANSFLDTCVSPHLYGNLCKQPVSSQPVYKIFHLPEPVPASIPDRNRSICKYVI